MTGMPIKTATPWAGRLQSRKITQVQALAILDHAKLPTPRASAGAYPSCATIKDNKHVLMAVCRLPNGTWELRHRRAGKTARKRRR